MFWDLLARLLARPSVVTRLIARAMRTPYFHITSPDGNDVYMRRFWLFNPYPREGEPDTRGWLMRHLPSIRLHHIMRQDDDRDLHDHPWNARTFVLNGAYREVRSMHRFPDGTELRKDFWRNAGQTARLKYGEYHRITAVSGGGVWTMFVTGKKRGTWGFDVGGTKVPWREYLGIKDAA